MTANGISKTDRSTSMRTPRSTSFSREPRVLKVSKKKRQTRQEKAAQQAQFMNEQAAQLVDELSRRSNPSRRSEIEVKEYLTGIALRQIQPSKRSRQKGHRRTARKVVAHAINNSGVDIKPCNVNPGWFTHVVDQEAFEKAVAA